MLNNLISIQCLGLQQICWHVIKMLVLNRPSSTSYIVSYTPQFQLQLEQLVLEQVSPGVPQTWAS